MRLLCAVRILYGAVFISASVLGQTADEITRLRLIDEARKASNAGDDARALSLAERAAQIRMTPSLRLFIAQEQTAVGQLASSFDNAEMCVREASEDRALKNRQQVLRTCKGLIAELQMSAARIIVSLPSPVPPQTQVLVNGRIVPEVLYGRAYLVSPGHVRIEAKAPEHVPFESELEVRALEEATVTVLLPQELSAAQEAASPGSDETTTNAQPPPIDAEALARTEARNKAQADYDLHYIGFYDLDAVFEGKDRKPLEGSAFYQKIGRQDLVEAYQGNERLKTGVRVAGVLAMVGGTVLIVWAIAQGQEDCGSASSPGFSACVDRNVNDHSAIVKTLIGTGVVLGGAGMFWGSYHINLHPVDAVQARALADEYNHKLKSKLGLASSEDPVLSRRHEIQVAIAPFVIRSGGGLALGLSF